MNVIKEYHNDNDNYELHVFIYQDMSYKLKLKTKDGKNTIQTGGDNAHDDVLKDDFAFENDEDIGIVKNKRGGCFKAMNRSDPYRGASRNVADQR